MKILGNINGSSGGSFEQLTTAERDARINMTVGYTIFNTTVGELQTYTGDGWQCHSSMYGIAKSEDRVPLNGSISIDPNAPTYITGLVKVSARGIDVVDASTGTIQSQANRNIGAMGGTISISPINDNNQPATLYIMAEYSFDMVTWSQAPNTLRTIELSPNSKAFGTKVAYATALPDGIYYRFMFVASVVDVRLEKTSFIVKGNQVESDTFTWELQESNTID